ncbi:MAG: zinc ribbon domain-containing protein [Bacillota bacterium]
MFRNLFQGRYGVDNLSIALVILSVVLNWIPFGWVLSYVAFGLAIFRAFSRNTFKRQMELQKFNTLFGPAIRAVQNFFSRIRSTFMTKRMKWNQRKTHIFFKCAKCGKTLRLPRGKGKLEVKCPTCGEKSRRNT